MILWPRVTHFIYALSFACTSVECKWVQKTSSFAPAQNWGTPLTHTSCLVFTHNHVSYVVVGKQQITLMDKILSHAQISEKCKNCYIFWKIVDFTSQIFHFVSKFMMYHKLGWLTHVSFLTFILAVFCKLRTKCWVPHWSQSEGRIENLLLSEDFILMHISNIGILNRF